MNLKRVVRFVCFDTEEQIPVWRLWLMMPTLIILSAVGGYLHGGRHPVTVPFVKCIDGNMTVDYQSGGMASARCAGLNP